MAKVENGKVHTPRLCHVIKKDDFDGYGFNLHAEKGKPGQYIGKVDDGSPAETAGLKQGDRIIEVNAVNIGSETHKQVVQRIKAIASEVQLLVVDPSVPVTKDNKLIDPPPPRNGSVLTAVTPPVVPVSVDQTDKATIESTTTTNTISTPDIVLQLPSTPSTPKDDQQRSAPPSPPAQQPQHTNNNSSRSMTESPLSIKSDKVATKLVNGDSIAPVTSAPATNGSPKMMTSMSSVGSAASTSSTSSVGGGAVAATTDPSTITPKVTASMGGLNLNMTAAELRAKLAAKKKFDPKNDSVDLRKKFEIVQKL